MQTTANDYTLVIIIWIQEAIVNMSKSRKNTLVLPVKVQVLLVKVLLVAWPWLIFQWPYDHNNWGYKTLS